MDKWLASKKGVYLLRPFREELVLDVPQRTIAHRSEWCEQDPTLLEFPEYSIWDLSLLYRGLEESFRHPQLMDYENPLRYISPWHFQFRDNWKATQEVLAHLDFSAKAYYPQILDEYQAEATGITLSVATDALQHKSASFCTTYAKKMGSSQSKHYDLSVCFPNLKDEEMQVITDVILERLQPYLLPPNPARKRNE